MITTESGSHRARTDRWGLASQTFPNTRHTIAIDVRRNVQCKSKMKTTNVLDESMNVRGCLQWNGSNRSSHQIKKDPFLSFYQIQNGARAVFLSVHNLYPDSLSRGAACSTFVPTNNAPCSQIQWRSTTTLLKKYQLLFVNHFILCRKWRIAEQMNKSL